MPGSMHTIDSGLPRFKGTESAEDKIDALQNYLFMLQEELQYLLHNLGMENINENALKSLKTEIAHDVSIRIGDETQGMSEVLVDMAGIHQRVQDAEGNISTLEQTASGLTSRVTSAEGNISSLNTAVDGKIDSEAAQSLIQQTMSAITLSVSSGSGGSSISLTSGGTTITSPTIDLNVKAANISGKLTASQIETEDLKLTTLWLKNSASSYSEAITSTGSISGGTADMKIGGQSTASFRKIDIFASNDVEISGYGGEGYTTLHINVYGNRIYSDYEYWDIGSPSNPFYYGYFYQMNTNRLMPTGSYPSIGTSLNPWSHLYVTDVYLASTGDDPYITGNSTGMYLGNTKALFAYSSGSIKPELGTDTYIWGKAHAETVRIHYSSYRYVDLTCNSAGKLCVNGTPIN